jgi:hypothetical protein
MGKVWIGGAGGGKQARAVELGVDYKYNELLLNFKIGVAILMK